MKRKNSSKLNNNVKYIVSGVVVLIVLIAIVLICYNLFFKKDDKKLVIKHDTVDELYENVKSTNCSYIKEVNKDKLTDDAMLYVVFSNLANNKKLSDNVSYNDYKNAAKKVLGEEKVIPENFENYEYDGYSYTLKDNKISRTKGTCGDKEYISKLYGYSYNDNELIVDMRVGYKKDGKLYDLDNKELGKYSKKTSNALMDSATPQVLTYKKDGNNYILENVTR